MLDLEELLVVNLNRPPLLPELEPWYDCDTIFLDTCVRKTWVAQAGDLAGFPFMGGTEGRAEKLTGEEAYSFLLRLKCGMESPKFAETNIDGQFMEATQTFARKCRTKYQKMARLLEILKADARYIRANYIDKLQKSTIETAAKSLSEFRPKENIFIIGKVGRNNTISQITTDLFLALRRASHIFYTAPVEADMGKLTAHFESENIRRNIQKGTSLIPVPFTQSADVFADGAHVFIDQPMGDNAWNDSFLIDAWKRTAQRGFKMVHLRGSPHMKGESTKIWRNAELESYFGPEDVRARKIKIDENNSHLLLMAHRAIMVISVKRAAGELAHAHNICGAMKIPESGINTQYCYT